MLIPEAPVATVQGLADQLKYFELTDRLYRAVSLTEAYEVGLDGILGLLGCKRASILRFDIAGKMRFVGWRGLSETYRMAFDGHSPWKQGELDPQPIFIPDIAQSLEDDQVKADVLKEGIKALVFVPLTLNGACAGKFMAYFDEPYEFTEREKQICLIISRQLSFCIERQTADFSASRLQALINSSTDAIVAKDLNSVIQHWNPGAQRLFGYSPVEAIGRSVTMLIPEDRLQEEDHILGRIKRGELVEHYETIRRHKNGSLVPVSLTVSPIIDADGHIIGASKIARDITEQQRAREHQDLLLREMNHRVKNLFAVTSSIVNLNARTATTPQELAASLTAKLGALGRSHSLTMANATINADTNLFDILAAVLEPFRQSDARVRISGTNFPLTGQAITPLSLLFHELATNTAKYGSLSNEQGQVEVTSEVGEENRTITWRETGGPLVELNRGIGFGSRLIEASMTQLNATLRREWLPAGLVFQLQLPK